jgi:hypothetical protein
MKRNLLVPALALLLAGCVSSAASEIQITSRAAPSDPKTCKFAAGGESLLGPGILDVGAGFLTYGLAVYVTNNLEDPHSTTPEALTSSKAWSAFAAKVRVNPKDYVDQFGASPPLLPITDENVLPLDGATTPVGGSNVQFVDAVSQPLGAKLMAALGAGAPRSVILGITLEGHTADGARLDSGEWFFPLTVCSGCLATPTCTGTQTLVPGSCFGPGQDSGGVCQ